MIFEELNLSNPLLNALNDLGYTTPSTIQARAFSAIMSGRDVMGLAQTGTGKTLAYLLPSLRQWKFQKNPHPQVLIIVPTRELVQQVVREAEKLTTYQNVKIGGVYGGANIRTQMQLVNQGLDILVGTPGRLLDIALTGVLRFKMLRKLIIDEVDETLNEGFRPQLERIFELLPEKRQNLMFSATLNEDVEKLLVNYFNDPLKIEAAASGTPLEQIEQRAYDVPNFNTKLNFLKHLIQTEPDFTKVLVFTGGRRLADQLFERLEEEFEDTVGVIHSNKSQNNRFNTLRRFREGVYNMLIATDLVARGIDVNEITHVVNFDLPNEPQNYIHRIGRTGRVDKSGIAISFVTPKDESRMRNIQGFMKKDLKVSPCPEEVPISEVLTYDEMPSVFMPEVEVKITTPVINKDAFHEKKAKNRKVNKKVRYADKMKLKYKKPKTRGAKPRGKKSNRKKS